MQMSVLKINMFWCSWLWVQLSGGAIEWVQLNVGANNKKKKKNLRRIKEHLLLNRGLLLLKHQDQLLTPITHLMVKNKIKNH